MIHAKQHWQEIMHIHTSNSITDEVGYVFLARDLSDGAPEFEDTEGLTIKMLPLAEALQWMHREEYDGRDFRCRYTEAGWGR
jgi:hypothetical protein